MRKNQYQCMSELQDSLRKLYDTINYSPKEIPIATPNGMVQALAFANKGMSASYIELLNRQVREAIKISDGIRLDQWSEKEYQEELEKKVNDYGAAMKACEKEKTVCEEKLQKQNERIAELEERLREQESHPVKDSGEEMKELIKNMISFRDGQLIKRDYLLDQGQEPDSVPVRIVDATLKETASLLKKSGVEILEDDGAFSSQRQTIVDVKETEDADLDGQIAEVVRPGYIYDGEQLRGQEVIIYKMKE